MAAQVQITNVDAYGQSIYVTFNIVLSGSYPTGGDPLNFTSGGTLPVIADPTFVGLLAAVESSSCLNIDVWSQGGGAVAGSSTVAYNPVITQAGTPKTVNPQTGIKLKCGVLNTYGTEHSAASYEAAYTADLVTGMAVFTKLL